MTQPASTEAHATALDLVERVRNVTTELIALERTISGLLNHDPGDGPDAYCVSWDINFGGPKGDGLLDVPASLLDYDHLDQLLLRAGDVRDLLHTLLNIPVDRARNEGVLPY